MPFDESFVAVFDSLICPAFRSAGFHVYRADDIASQQSILRDIVTAIATAAVVVADLTDSNPNVYYELGLAHALQKPVVLITQDLGGVPFDLRSYRVIEYDTRFDRFEDAKRRLTELARQIAEGEVTFGNPVSDFRADTASVQVNIGQATAPSVEDDETETDKPGFLDHVVDVEEGFEKVTAIITAFGEHVTAIGQEAQDTTPNLTEAGNAKNLRRARSLLRSLGGSYEKHRTELRELNRQFRQVWTDTANSLEMVITHPLSEGQESTEERYELIKAVDTMATSSETSKASLTTLVRTMNGLPAMEKVFDRSKRRMVDELSVFNGYIRVSQMA